MKTDKVTATTKFHTTTGLKFTPSPYEMSQLCSGGCPTPDPLLAPVLKVNDKTGPEVILTTDDILTPDGERLQHYINEVDNHEIRLGELEQPFRTDISLVGIATQDYPLKVQFSKSLGNALELKTDGIYVANSSGPEGPIVVDGGNWDTV